MRNGPPAPDERSAIDAAQGAFPIEEAGDEILADRAADGDTRAFAVLVRRYAGLLRAYAYRVLGPGGGLDDAVQETFITAWAELPRLENRAAVRAWLLRIVTRKALDAARASRPSSELDDAVLPPERSAEESATAPLRAALDTALSELPQEQRRVWLLREVGGYGYDEIAAELGIPASTVRGQLARARKRLVERMEDWR